MNVHPLKIRGYIIRHAPVNEFYLKRGLSRIPTLDSHDLFLSILNFLHYSSFLFFSPHWKEKGKMINEKFC